jgi:acyl-CoA thioesterase I
MTGSFIFDWFRLLRLRKHCPGPARSTLRAGCRVAIIITLGAVPGALASACALANPEPVSSARPAPDRRALPDEGATILVLGDSISAGYGIQREQSWVSQLGSRVAGEGSGWQVVNASTSGETTGGALARLPGALDEHQPEVVIIELGGNDGLRGYPVGSIRANLEAMVALAKDAGSRVLLVGMQIPPNYGPRYTRAFADVFTAVAEAHGVPLVPFLLDEVALRPELMQRDGIHPTAEAQDLLLDAVWPHLAPLLEG